MKNKGILFVISGPSGVGKGTVCERLMADCPELSVSVSATTRAPRSIDREGVTYFFKTKKEFEEMIAENRFLEYAQYNGNYYGTPAEKVDEMLAQGKDVILEIEVQGAQTVMEKRKDAVTIFILPPGEEALYERLRNRGTESEEQIEKRINAAKEEMKQKDKYDYRVVNDVLEDAVCEVEAIIKKVKENDVK